MKKKPQKPMSAQEEKILEADIVKRAAKSLSNGSPACIGVAIAGLLQSYTDNVIERHGRLEYDPHDLNELEEGMETAYRVFEQTELVDYPAARDILSFLVGWLDQQCLYEEDIIDNDLLH